MSDDLPTVRLPQWLAEDLLAVLRAARDLPDTAAAIDRAVDCEPGFLADVAAHLERVLRMYPLVSTAPDTTRFFTPVGGAVPRDVVLLLRRTRPGRVHYAHVRGGAVRSMPEAVFFEHFEELSRDELRAAFRGGTGDA